MQRDKKVPIKITFDYRDNSEKIDGHQMSNFILVNNNF